MLWGLPKVKVGCGKIGALLKVTDADGHRTYIADFQLSPV
jgi:hypothetical protein